MKLARLPVIVLLFAASSFASDLAATFQQAYDLAEAQDKIPGMKEYQNQTLMPYWQQKYGPIFQSCFKSVKQPDGQSFAFVAAIGLDGKVVRVFVDHETSIYQCLLPTLKNDTFPAPPQAPFYLSIGMRFDMDTPPSSKASSDGAPPLVVGPDKYSYTFGVPAGWEFNFEQAHQRGASLAFFPKGGSFNESSSVIFVSEINCECEEEPSRISVAIAKTIREVKDENPAVEVSAEPSVRTRDGDKAAIRILRGSKDPRDPQLKDNEALAFIGHDEATILVVLTARDSKTWNEDYAAFQQIVAGHKFFTCNSPDLAVPCRK